MSDRPSSTLCPSCGSLVGVNDDQCLTCGRRNPGMFGLTAVLRGMGDDLGFANIVLGGCGTLYLVSLIATSRVNPDALMGGHFLNFLGPSWEALVVMGGSGAVPVYGLGHYWSLLSAGWLHGGLLHIAFNMMSARDLIPAMANLYGPGRTVLVWTIGSVVGFLASSTVGAFFPVIPGLKGGQLTVGASAAIFGLIGALYHYGGQGSSVVREHARRWAISGLFMGFLPGLNVDNWAHIGGFVGGYLASRWLNPFVPERGDHVLLALACLGGSLVAVVASVLVGVSYFR